MGGLEKVPKTRTVLPILENNGCVSPFRNTLGSSTFHIVVRVVVALGDASSCRCKQPDARGHDAGGLRTGTVTSSDERSDGQSPRRDGVCDGICVRRGRAGPFLAGSHRVRSPVRIEAPATFPGSSPNCSPFLNVPDRRTLYRTSWAAFLSASIPRLARAPARLRRRPARRAPRGGPGPAIATDHR